MPRSAPRRRSRRAKRPPERHQPAPESAKKKRKLTTNEKQKPGQLEEVKSDFKFNQHICFVDTNGHNVRWTPLAPKVRKDSKILKALRKHKNDIHSFFITSEAAKVAADPSGGCSAFRHIGSASLERCKLESSTQSHSNWLAYLEKSNDELVSLAEALPDAKCSNDAFRASLESLSTPHQRPWNIPFIVVLADRKDVIKACQLQNRRTASNLNVQIYAGRMLFELIACRDIKVMFESLHSPHKFDKVPSIPDYPATFDRSPPLDDPFSVGAVLRSAESTGYDGLSAEQKEKISKCLKVTLFPYQEQTVRWMIDRENGAHSLNAYFWEERSYTGPANKPDGKFYYFPMSGEVRLNRPPDIRGGMVTEEMGLGKTVEALALIAAQQVEHKQVELDVWCENDPTDLTVEDNIVKLKRLRISNIDKASVDSPFCHEDFVIDDAEDCDFPKSVKIRRWLPKATLVICPKSLIGQWKQEARDKAPSLSVKQWGSSRRLQHKADETLAIGKNAKDIILATYEDIRTDQLLSKISWRRVILDEAQLTRRSSTLIANDVFNLRAGTRFLMTGTPIVHDIDDLKGELAMLKVWPFTLDVDGFWESHVVHPYVRRQNTATLSSLLRVTMIRHSKAQGLGIALPIRQYGTIEVDLVASHRSLYSYVLGSCLDELEAQNPRHRDTRRLRVFVNILIGICLSPGLLELVALDLARRFTWSRRSSPASFDAQGCPMDFRKVSPREAIRFVAECATRIVRDSNRKLAVTHDDSSDILDRLRSMPLEELRQEVLSKNLLTVARARHARRERLAAVVAGGVHRIKTDSLQELRKTAEEVGLVTSEEATTLSKTAALAKLQLHYDIQKGIDIGRTVHESGFAALTKLIESRGNPSCPVCLFDCEGRIGVTKCGHLYCLECVTNLLENRYGASKCAICRRGIDKEAVVEIVRMTKKVKELEDEDDTDVGMTEKGNTDCGSSSCGDASTPEVEVRFHTTGNSVKRELEKPSAEQAWSEYNELGAPPAQFNDLGLNPAYPSLDVGFLRHLAAAQQAGESPKLRALLSFIRSVAKESKFCVVANSLQSLKAIYLWLTKHRVKCVGPGISFRGGKSGSMDDASAEFATNPKAKVFLLNPKNSSGLNLIAAEYVIFMETLVRAADEIQAVGRVHRIGQKKDVKVIRIVARNTIEEHLIAQRGEIRTAEEESQALAAVGHMDVSDCQVLNLFRNPDEATGNASELNDCGLSRLN